jgi:hypothetical protein
MCKLLAALPVSVGIFLCISIVDCKLMDDDDFAVGVYSEILCTDEQL